MKAEWWEWTFGRTDLVLVRRIKTVVNSRECSASTRQQNVLSQMHGMG